MKDTHEEYQKKLQRLSLLETRLDLQQNLPHLHGTKLYQWQRDFFESSHKENFLCAANQIGKSSVQIRKAIHWATEPTLWPKLWSRSPQQFWYLYPDRALALVEVLHKWEREFLPRGKYKDHPQYGWRLDKDRDHVKALHFNTGVSLYFKTYSQNPQSLQAGTVWAIFCDEELPENLYDELNLRRAANDGYYHMVFTATLGQELWRRTVEETGDKERFKGAFKRQISMYDCLYYEDGTPSHWTVNRIKRLEASCKSQAEVDRRIYGRFVKDEDLKYPSFDRSLNVQTAKPIPADWIVYAGIDIGGGGTSHPSAISFVAVSPDYTQGRVFRGWRGDNIVTTASDVLAKYIELSRGLNVAAVYYDFSAKDFGTIAARAGISVNPAEKSHAIGEQTLNVLFKNLMLIIDDIDELTGLMTEFATLSNSVGKAHATDDHIDSVRYCCAKIPWNFAAIGPQPTQTRPTQLMSHEEMARRGLLQDGAESLLDEEFEAWNELYDP